MNNPWLDKKSDWEKRRNLLERVLAEFYNYPYNWLREMDLEELETVLWMRERV